MRVSARRVRAAWRVFGNAYDGPVVRRHVAEIRRLGGRLGAVRDVVAKNPDQVAQFKAGKDKVMGFFVGQVMKATGGKANAQVVQELLRAALQA